MRGRGGRQVEELRRAYGDHVRAVYAFFASSVDSSVAEDLTSATFERVVRCWSRYDRRRSSERTWILVIARNVLIDHLRRADRRPQCSLDERPELFDRLAAADDELDRILDQDQLRAWLTVLGERERVLLALRYGGDMSAAQIAEAMGLTPANVHQILSRSLRRLREHAPEGDLLTGSVSATA